MYDTVQTHAFALELKGVTRRFGDFTAVDAIDLQIKSGEFFTLVGPSGSGKTTMIRMLVGMDTPTEGDLLLNGQRINDLPANRRPTCMVFQSLALFPHKSVGENIGFPMKIAGVERKERRKRVLDFLEQVQLPASYYDKGIAQCSGGEKQRVALARALAFDPEILFFDEPLSALDFRLRKTLEKALKELHSETGKTFVYITHSLEEAMVMSDRIGIMRDGKLVQVGDPHEIYKKPANHFVAQFMGEINSLSVTHAGCNLVKSSDGREFRVAIIPEGFTDGFLIVRPEAIRINQSDVESDNILKAKLTVEYPMGSRNQFVATTLHPDEKWQIERLQDEDIGAVLGDEVTISWRPEDCILVSE